MADWIPNYSEVVFARTVSVIEVKVVAGSGTEEDPRRPIFEYWATDGTLLAVRDEKRDWRANGKIPARKEGCPAEIAASGAS